MSNLSELDLSKNKIRYLPDTVLSGPFKLTKLLLSNNKIKRLPDSVFSRLPYLTRLALSNNKIRRLTNTVFRGLFKLTQLVLSNNKMTTLPSKVFSGLSLLTKLDLSNNRIADLPDVVFHGLSELTYLTLHNNQIGVFHELPILSQLRLSRNRISACPSHVFIGMPLLFLHLENNSISFLPVLPFTLTSLDLSHNGLTSLPTGTFLNNSKLSYLNIIGNKLEVTEYIFEGLNRLDTLLTDTPFMCCVKPKSVTNNKCLRKPVKYLKCVNDDVTCESESDAISSCYALISSGALRACLWVIGVSALIGNVFVLFYRFFIDNDNITKSYSVFVLNLAISDLLMGVYLLIIGIADIYYNDVYAWNENKWRTSIACSAAGILSSVSSEMSTFLILLVTIDRLVVIVFPMSRLSRRNISWRQATVVSVFLWIVAITLAVIPVIAMQFYFRGEYYSQSGVCLALPLTNDTQPGAEYSFAVFVSLVFVVIVIGQICIFKSMKTSGCRITSSQTRQREMSVARTFFMVVLTDFFCWCPIGVMGVLSKCGTQIPDHAYAWVMVFVLPVNAAVNPFLYTISAMWRNRQRDQQSAAMTSPTHTMQLQCLSATKMSETAV